MFLRVLQATFDSSGDKLGDTETIVFKHPFGVMISGSYTGTILLDFSYDDGDNWTTVKAYSGASPLTEVDRINIEKGGMRVRLNCTALSSGTPTVTIMAL